MSTPPYWEGKVCGAKIKTPTKSNKKQTPHERRFLIDVAVKRNKGRREPPMDNVALSIFYRRNIIVGMSQSHKLEQFQRCSGRHDRQPITCAVTIFPRHNTVAKNEAMSLLQILQRFINTIYPIAGNGNADTQKKRRRHNRPKIAPDGSGNDICKQRRYAKASAKNIGKRKRMRYHNSNDSTRYFTGRDGTWRKSPRRYL